MQEPLCGQDWYIKHRLDYTQADIDAQTIQVKVDERQLPVVRNTDSKRSVANMVKVNRDYHKREVK